MESSAGARFKRRFPPCLLYWIFNDVVHIKEELQTISAVSASADIQSPRPWYKSRGCCGRGYFLTVFWLTLIFTQKYFRHQMQLHSRPIAGQCGPSRTCWRQPTATAGDHRIRIICNIECQHGWLFDAAAVCRTASKETPVISCYDECWF